MEKRQLFFICFLVVGLFVLFFNLWGRSLENHDYLRYCEVAKEMIQSGEYGVPHLNGRIYLHKPPLLFWLIALPSKIHGSVTPFFARLPSALFALIGGIVVYFWGKRLQGDDRSGLISSGILITTYLYFWQARIARTDMVFSVLILISLYLFYLSYLDCESYPPSAITINEHIKESDRAFCNKKLYLFLSFFFTGLAGLTKGPVGIIFPILIISLFLLRDGKLKILIKKESILGYLTIGMTLSIWLISFLYRVGLNTAFETWRETKILSRRAPIYLYIYRIWLDFAPWSIFLPHLIFYYWQKKRNRKEEFLIIWFIGLFILLSLFPYRASKYILPAFPPLALLMGSYWRQKRSTILFCLLIAGTILSYHGYEYFLIKKNGEKTIGPVLYKEIKSYKDIFGYKMDVDTLGKINFYWDGTIPLFLNEEELFKKVKERGEIAVIMKESVKKELIQQGFQVSQCKRINYKEENLIILKIKKLGSSTESCQNHKDLRCEGFKDSRVTKN